MKRAFFYLCLLAIFALLLKGGLWLVADNRAKLDHGQITQALVTGKNIKISGRHHQFVYHNLYFQYKVGKKAYTEHWDVGEEKYDAARIGSRITITYLPENPTDIQLGAATKKTFFIFSGLVTYFLAFVGIAFAVLIIANEKAVRNQTSLRAGVSKMYLSTVLSQRTASVPPKYEE